MRKRNKKKKGGGCALCKPHKHAKEKYLTPKNQESLKEFEKRIYERNYAD